MCDGSQWAYVCDCMHVCVCVFQCLYRAIWGYLTCVYHRLASIPHLFQQSDTEEPHEIVPEK